MPFKGRGCLWYPIQKLMYKTHEKYNNKTDKIRSKSLIVKELKYY